MNPVQTHSSLTLHSQLSRERSYVDPNGERAWGSLKRGARAQHDHTHMNTHHALVLAGRGASFGYLLVRCLGFELLVRVLALVRA